MSFSGPLPHPDLLAGYEDVLPGAAERIIAMAENQAAHRIHLERVVVEGDSRRSWWGLRIGAVLTTITVVGGISLMHAGKSGWGFALIVAQACSLGGAFIYAQHSRRKERLAKMEPSERSAGKR